MFTLISKFRLLDSGERFLFLHAFFLHGLFRLAVLTLPFRWLTRSFCQHGSDWQPTVSLSRKEQQVAIAVQNGIRRASRYTPWKSACLVQALTACSLLRKHHISGMFCLGLKRKDDTDHKMEAHAWCKCGALFITGEAGHDEFTVLSVFTWGKQ
jgi:hypothetical protein